ncbi:MAG: HEPN domain-containing protein [Sedimentisphaerales bacterium]|nr:HEPN domain-containing protein [Sedimentisphaerales bacterium]
MNEKSQQWLKQADYDISTAEFMCKGGRFFYAVLMCHLSVEKALKGLYLKKSGQAPPKTHNLVYLLNKVGIKPEDKMGLFVAKLNEANIATRYPEDIDKLQKDYTEPVAEEILNNTMELLEWIKKQF